jgi:hypothetical protein
MAINAFAFKSLLQRLAGVAFMCSFIYTPEPDLAYRRADLTNDADYNPLFLLSFPTHPFHFIIAQQP